MVTTVGLRLVLMSGPGRAVKVKMGRRIRVGVRGRVRVSVRVRVRSQHAHSWAD